MTLPEWKKSSWIPRDDPEYQTPVRVWQCGVCGGVQGISRQQCHNCYVGTRPRMSPALRKEHDDVWAAWDRGELINGEPIE